MNSNQDEEKFNNLYIKAMEERPEQFVPASMPYVKCKINGIDLIALIDSGSMITASNLEVANKCDFLSEVDTRVKIPVAGVGNKVSIGQNYGVNIDFGDNQITMPIVILDIQLTDCDLLIGLDLLRSFRANIDFQSNQLVLNSIGSTISTKLLSDQEKKEFIQIKKLIEISGNKLNKDEALAYLHKHDFNFEDCVNDIVGL